MKIGMMTAWNQTSGVSIHAELVGKAWIEQGHDLYVFSFIENDFHGRSLIGQDEEYVTRCFGTRQLTNYLDPTPFLERDYDVFVAQDINMVPMDKLQKIFHLIKGKAKTIHVVHESKMSSDPSFYQHDWDAFVCFDERFKGFLVRIYPQEKVHIIPFPCSKWNPGEKREARRELGLPLEAKIVFLFGQKWRHIQQAEIQAFRELQKEYDMQILIISETQRVTGINLPACYFKKEVLERDKLFRYLHASDCWLFPKRSIDNYAVLSSTIHYAMGSGCVPIAWDSNFLYTTRETVLHYQNGEEFKKCLIEAFEQGGEWKKAREAAHRFTETYNGEKIAQKFIELFRS